MKQIAIDEIYVGKDHYLSIVLDVVSGAENQLGKNPEGKNGTITIKTTRDIDSVENRISEFRQRYSSAYSGKYLESLLRHQGDWQSLRAADIIEPRLAYAVPPDTLDA